MFTHRTVQRIVVTAIVTAVGFGASAIAADDLTKVDVFRSGTEGYHTFRIPSLVVTKKGTLLAICEGRKTSRADLGNNDLMLKRSTDGGKTWGKLQLVYEEGGDKIITIGNPTAVVDQDTGNIILVFLRKVRDVLVTTSKDDGKTWSKPVNITKQVKDPAWKFYAVGPGVGIQLRHGPNKGRIVIPAYHRKTANKSGASESHVFYSDDHGKTWKLGGTVGPHTNECQVAETLVDGKSVLLINARNHWARSGGRRDLAGRRIIARSDDGGKTWSKPQFDKQLVEPTCQASLLRYETPKQSLLLFANPASTSRSNMTVRVSRDEGKTWTAGRTVEKGSAAYSCLAVLKDGRIALIYERDNYGKIRFASFPLEWLAKQSKH